MKKDESEKKREKFLELRGVQRKSFDVISKELGVSKQTLINWSVSHSHDLQNIRAAKYENLLKDLKLSRFERVKYYAELYNKLRDELDKRDLNNIATVKLYNLLTDLDEHITVQEKYESEHGSIFEECNDLTVD